MSLLIYWRKPLQSLAIEVEAQPEEKVCRAGAERYETDQAGSDRDRRDTSRQSGQITIDVECHLS